MLIAYLETHAHVHTYVCKYCKYGAVSLRPSDRCSYLQAQQTDMESYKKIRWIAFHSVDRVICWRQAGLTYYNIHFNLNKIKNLKMFIFVPMNQFHYLFYYFGLVHAKLWLHLIYFLLPAHFKKCWIKIPGLKNK